jgi:HPt (histidine-containing phosphotransfer) domain-containing protein
VGFDDILIKPFKRPDIEKALQAWPPGKASSLFSVQGDVSPGDAAFPPESAPPEAKVSAPLQVFNRAGLIETFMGNEEMIRSLLVRFIDRTREQIAAGIPCCMEAADWETARREAHTIKGSALTLTAGELGQAAARLELAFKNGDRAGMNAALPPVADAFARFEAEVSRFLAETAGQEAEVYP